MINTYHPNAMWDCHHHPKKINTHTHTCHLPRLLRHCLSCFIVHLLLCSGWCILHWNKMSPTIGYKSGKDPYLARNRNVWTAPHLQLFPNFTYIRYFNSVFTNAHGSLVLGFRFWWLVYFLVKEIYFLQTEEIILISQTTKNIKILKSVESTNNFYSLIFFNHIRFEPKVLDWMFPFI